MAVVVKDFTWKQTDDHIVVKVPLKGVPPNKVDILTSDTYVKASFKPFIFEAFLSHPIQDLSSRCTISNGEIEFYLKKSEKTKVWNDLCVDLNRQEKAEAREEALSRILERSENEKAAKQELLQKLQRKSVQQQIELETAEKKMVEVTRNSERTNAMEELEAWKTSKESVSVGLSCREDTPKVETNSPEIWDADSCKSSDDEGELDNVIPLTEEDLRPVPITRACGSIRVKFTPRVFPTPQRESKMEEEQEWLEKQAAAQRSVGFVVEDLRPEECDPQWLKEKGDSFFKVGNYLGAISAYSHGIKLSKNLAGLYVNRSAAHFALGNLQRVIEDCSTALELMTPKVQLNEDSRAKCHVRRGAALCKLGMLQPGLADLEAAFKIKPNDKKLQKDILDVKLILEKSDD